MSETLNLPQYAATTETGTISKRRRADTCILYNPLVGNPRVEFFEQQVMTLPDGETIVTPTETLSLEVADQNLPVPLLNPVTLQPTGKTISAAEIELILVSLYIMMAQARDAT